MGPSARHGPHHSAQRSTIAAPRCASTSVANVSSVTSRTFGSFLTSLILHLPPILRIGISISVYITTRRLVLIPVPSGTPQRLSRRYPGEAAERLLSAVAPLPAGAPMACPPPDAPRAHSRNREGRLPETDRRRTAPLAKAR